MFKVLITDKLAKQGIDLLNSTDGVEGVVKTGPVSEGADSPPSRPPKEG